MRGYNIFVSFLIITVHTYLLIFYIWNWSKGEDDGEEYNSQDKHLDMKKNEITKENCNGDLHTWELEREVYSGANTKAHLENLF